MPGMDEQLINAREAALSFLSTLYWTRQALKAVDVEVLGTRESVDNRFTEPISGAFQYLSGSVERFGEALPGPVLLALERANLAFSVTPWTEEFDGVPCKSYHYYCYRVASRFSWLPGEIPYSHGRQEAHPPWVNDMRWGEDADQYPAQVRFPEGYYHWSAEDRRSFDTKRSAEESDYYRRLLESVDNEPKYDVDLLGRLIWEECDRALAHLESLPGATLTRLGKGPGESQTEETANEGMSRRPLPALTRLTRRVWDFLSDKDTPQIYDDITEALTIGRESCSRALKELRRHGLIVDIRGGGVLANSSYQADRTKTEPK